MFVITGVRYIGAVLSFLFFFFVVVVVFFFLFFFLFICRFFFSFLFFFSWLKNIVIPGSLLFCGSLSPGSSEEKPV